MKKIIFIILLAFVAALLVVFYTYVKQDQNIQLQNALNNSDSITASESVDEFAVNANRFVSKNLGYAILYPQSWFARSLSDVYAQFNNVKDADYIVSEDGGSPLDLSTEGIWISIKKFLGSDRIKESREMHQSWNIDSEEKISLGGREHTKQFVSPGPQFQGGGRPYLRMYLDLEDRTYSFDIIYFDESVYRKQEDVINKIIGSLQLL